MPFLSSLKVKAVLAVILTCSIFYGGYYLRDLQCDLAVADIHKAHQAAVVAQMDYYQESIAKAEESALKRTKERKHAERIIYRDVIKYVQSDRDFCPLATDWVRIHDAAACGVSCLENPGAANDSPAGIVRDDAALVTITNNYADCHAEMDKLRELQGILEPIRARH